MLRLRLTHIVGWQKPTRCKAIILHSKLTSKKKKRKRKRRRWMKGYRVLRPVAIVSADTPMCFLERNHHYRLGYFPRLP